MPDNYVLAMKMETKKIVFTNNKAIIIINVPGPTPLPPVQSGQQQTITIQSKLHEMMWKLINIITYK